MLKLINKIGEVFGRTVALLCAIPIIFCGFFSVAGFLISINPVENRIRPLNRYRNPGDVVMEISLYAGEFYEDNSRLPTVTEMNDWIQNSDDNQEPQESWDIRYIPLGNKGFKNTYYGENFYKSLGIPSPEQRFVVEYWGGDEYLYHIPWINDRASYYIPNQVYYLSGSKIGDIIIFGLVSAFLILALSVFLKAVFFGFK